MATNHPLQTFLAITVKSASGVRSGWKVDISHDRYTSVISSRSSSVNDQGKRHVCAAIVTAFAVMWGVPILAAAAGMTWPLMLWVIGPLQIAWLLYFGIKSFMIACPQCGRSVFMRGLFWSVPWPAKRCGKCGNDLTAA